MLIKQKKTEILGWNRAEEVVPDATIINEINPRNVTQTMIGDCSFVSAMILSAGFERKFKKKILTCSFFPQKDGKPVLNPHGKYCVRLHINGCWRRVLIDSRFGFRLISHETQTKFWQKSESELRIPFDSHGQPMCAYSADRKEIN